MYYTLHALQNPYAVYYCAALPFLYGGTPSQILPAFLPVRLIFQSLFTPIWYSTDIAM